MDAVQRELVGIKLAELVSRVLPDFVLQCAHYCRIGKGVLLSAIMQNMVYCDICRGWSEASCHRSFTRSSVESI